MLIEAGKTYRDEAGDKIGPMIDYSNGNTIVIQGDGRMWRKKDGVSAGRLVPNLIAEWTEGPVRTVTRREIVDGTYGCVDINGGKVSAYVLWNTRTGPEKLRAAAATFLELAEALEDV